MLVVPTLGPSDIPVNNGTERIAMLKIKFDAKNLELAACIGAALVKYGAGVVSEAVEDNDTRVDFAGKAYPSESGELAEDYDARVEKHGTGVVADDPEPLEKPSVDDHGVAFDIEFCGEATEPFYGSGKKTGQWKKKRGVSEEDYGSWYNSQLLEQPLTETAEPGPIDTSAAFSGAERPAAAPGAPTNLGDFMLWVSELQGAGRITQADINAAYSELGIEPAAIFQGEEAEVAGHIRNLHAILSQK